MRMARQSSNDDEGEAAMAAVSALNTIAKIVDALESNHSRLVNISYMLVPIFDYCFSKQGSQYFEEAIQIYTCLYYYSD